MGQGCFKCPGGVGVEILYTEVSFGGTLGRGFGRIYTGCYDEMYTFGSIASVFSFVLAWCCGRHPGGVLGVPEREISKHGKSVA